MAGFTALAFDYGLKNIGVAVGQSLIQSAGELNALKARDGIPSWEDVAALIDEWQPSILVVGMPLNMDDSEGELARRSQKFGKRLHGRFHIDVAFVDERLSTREAKQIASERGHRGDYANAPVDSIAARLLLESWWRSQ